MTHCPTCGHPVKVVGNVTMHYEPVGCVSMEKIEEVLDEIKTGEDIYPSNIFSPLTKQELKEIDDLLKGHMGMRIDRISAYCMKHARDIALKDIRKELRKVAGE